MKANSTFTKILSTSATIAPVLFGCVFLISGTAKIFSFDSFLSTLHQFKIVEPVDVVIAAILIASELAVGGCIVMNRWRIQATVAAMSLLALFIMVITLNLGSVSGADCSCFGPLVENKLGGGVIIQDLFLLLFGLVSLRIITLHHQNA